MSTARIRTAVSILAVAILVASAFMLSSPAVEDMNEDGAEARIIGRARTVRDARTNDEGAWSVMTKGPAAGGWTDEMMAGKANDWEPAVAADPNDPYLYILPTRYGAKRGCNTCRHSGIAVLRSTDNGATWEPWEWLWEDGDGWQADPQIAVDDNGVVHAVLLAKPYYVWYTRSTDHGATWSEPVDITGGLKWADHPWLAVSPDGDDVYVGYNKHINYQITSNDGGFTWGEAIPTSPLEEDDYYFSLGGTVLPDETVLFTAADFGCCRYNDVAHRRPVGVWAIRSTDHGATWTETLIEHMAAPPPCTTPLCPKAYWGAESSIASDPAGTSMLVYSGGHTKFGKQRIWAVTSADGGATWSEPMAIGPWATAAGYPQVESTGTDEFVVWWVDIRNGAQKNNIWVTQTVDGGETWTDDDRLSNVTGGPGYKSAGGFKFFYGDYGDMDVLNNGNAVAVWSEGWEYWGPGNTWWAKQNQ